MPCRYGCPACRSTGRSCNHGAARVSLASPWPARKSEHSQGRCPKSDQTLSLASRRPARRAATPTLQVPSPGPIHPGKGIYRKLAGVARWRVLFCFLTLCLCLMLCTALLSQCGSSAPSLPARHHTATPARTSPHYILARSSAGLQPLTAACRRQSSTPSHRRW